MLASCARYQSPPREQWSQYLGGVSFTDMTEPARIAKKPIFQGDGGRMISTKTTPAKEYGDIVQNENTTYVEYMARCEEKLYDALRRPGISVQRAGTDIVVLMIRDAIMELNKPEISEMGDENLGKITKILKECDSTFIEIAGYTDSMRDTNAAHALSFDMAERVAVYMARHDIRPSRMFVVGRGAARPIAAQDEWGRLTNRRIEIRITPVR